MNRVWWNPAPLTAKIYVSHADATLAAGVIAARAAPVMTGALRASVRAHVVGPGLGQVVATDAAAMFVEAGTRPHEIAPTNRVLAGPDFGPVGGAVKHPGAKAQPFLAKAAQAFAALFISSARRRLP